jgi:predicted DNA-binding transcriptional regulator AlpA
MENEEEGRPPIGGAQLADRLIRFPEVERLTGIRGRPALGRLIKTQGFPNPIKFTGGRACAWSLRAIQSWIAARVAGAADGPR